jgi:hypothetical protein
MSTVNADNVQYVPLNDSNQTEKTNRSAVIHEPPPSYAQVNTQGLQNPYQYQTEPSVKHQNGQPIPVILETRGIAGVIGVTEKAIHVNDYTAWSIFNIFCCGLIFGACALSVSYTTKKRKLMGDIQGAREASRCAAGLNVVATISGIIGITLVILHETGKISF